MSEARMIVGDVFDALATIPDGSVDLVLTSSPFFNLRSYLPKGHEAKRREIGQELTPSDFIDTLLDVTEELARVIAPHGSLAWELGDSYWGSGGAGGDYNDGGLRDGQEKFKAQHKEGGPELKSLCLIPESYRWSLAYGRNPFNGRETPRWRVRNNVRWYRPNPPVGALGDKFRPATSDMVIACKSATRWFDLDAVRAAHKEEPTPGPDYTQAKRSDPSRGNGGDQRGFMMHHGNPVGAPPLDTWIIPTQPYSGSHYATWPEELCVKPILSMCPERVCRGVR